MEAIAVIIIIIGIYSLGFILGSVKSQSCKKEFDKGYESGRIDGIKEGYYFAKSIYKKEDCKSKDEVIDNKLK